MIWGLVALVALIIVAIKMIFFRPPSHLEKTYHSYLAALEQLKLDPTNTALKDEAVALGREYITVSQHHPEMKPVSESDLMRDIRAACGR